MNSSDLHTENEITVEAPPDLVYELAADVERWPEMLDHYRYVRPLPARQGQAGARRFVMSASRSGIPVSWTSIQELDPVGRRIMYHHIGGATRDMDVIWRIEPVGGETLVTIDHDLTGGHLWTRNPLVRYVMGRIFVMHIADQTLRGIKRRAEAAGARWTE